MTTKNSVLNERAILSGEYWAEGHTNTENGKDKRCNYSNTRLTSATQITEWESIFFVILQSINASTNGHSSAYIGLVYLSLCDLWTWPLISCHFSLPSFIWHAKTDDLLSPCASLMIMLNIRKEKNAVELYLPMLHLFIQKSKQIV